MSSLTTAQREQIQKDLLSMQSEIESKLKALGISKPVDPVGKAPDGGPTSQAHAFLVPHLHNTFRVVRKNEDGSDTECLVNERMFNSATMTRVEDLVRKPRVVEPAPSHAPAPTPAPTPAPAKKPIVVSKMSREEMLVMTTVQLRGLPEVDHIDEIPDRKTELVDAILAVREAAK